MGVAGHLISNIIIFSIQCNSIEKIKYFHVFLVYQRLSFGGPGKTSTLFILMKMLIVSPHLYHINHPLILVRYTAREPHKIFIGPESDYWLPLLATDSGF